MALVVAGISNTVFGAANPDPAATEILRLGPLRITEQALATGIALGLRVVAIASVGAVFALTTDSTRLVDSLVQQGRVPERFAYGAFAAYQAVPRFADDFATLRQARRIRGLRGTWHPRPPLGLLVLAIHDTATGWRWLTDPSRSGSGPRSALRVVCPRPGLVPAAARRRLALAGVGSRFLGTPRCHESGPTTVGPATPDRSLFAFPPSRPAEPLCRAADCRVRHDRRLTGSSARTRPRRS